MSPSYLIDNVYDDPDGVATLPGVSVHHMDLWRLPKGKISQLVDLPHIFSACVCLIEWPHLLGADLMPPTYLDVHLSIRDVGGDGGDGVEGAESAEAEARSSAGAAAADLFEKNEEGPRVATLTARGDEWERRLEKIRGVIYGLKTCDAIGSSVAQV